MSLSATVEKAVDSAFEAVGDLVKKGTLIYEESSGFNFSTGVTTKVTETRVVDVILTEAKVEEDESLENFNSPRVQALVKTRDIGFSRYTSITIEDISYRVEDIKQYAGITILLLRG